MSEASRLMVALAFISLPTIAFGGSFLLTLLKRQVGSEKITHVQREYFKAGHAHAGVLVTLAIISQLILDFSRFDEWAVWFLRIGLFIAPLLISAGFFGGAPRLEGGKPGALVKLIPVGAIIFSICAVATGISLLI